MPTPIHTVTTQSRASAARKAGIAGIARLAQILPFLEKVAEARSRTPVRRLRSF